MAVKVTQWIVCFYLWWWVCVCAGQSAAQLLQLNPQSARQFLPIMCDCAFIKYTAGGVWSIFWQPRENASYTWPCDPQNRVLPEDKGKEQERGFPLLCKSRICLVWCGEAWTILVYCVNKLTVNTFLILTRKSNQLPAVRSAECKLYPFWNHPKT